MEDAVELATEMGKAGAEVPNADASSDEKWFYFSVLLLVFIGLLQVMREMEKSKKSKLKKLKKMITANE